MSLPVNLQMGLSFDGFGIRTPDLLPSNNSINPVTSSNTISGQSVLEIINGRLNQNTISQFKFPLDLPKYNFTIIQHEGQSSILGGTPGGRRVIGKPTAIYRMSLPTRLVDSHQTVFSEISPLDVAKDAFKVVYGIQKRAKLGAIQRTLNKIGIPEEEAKRLKKNAEEDLFGKSDSVINAIDNSRGLIDTVGALAGVKLASGKIVTLGDDINFKTFALSWHFIPKSYQESVQIQKICFNLRKNMTPVSEGMFNFVNVFPSVYTMFFQPNVKFLYKFKPCVLTSIAVDYQPGGVPAFYKAQSGASSGSFRGAQEQGLNLQNSPPESVRLDTTWLELDYYVQQQYDNDHNDAEDLPSNDPYGLLKDSYTFTG